MEQEQRYLEALQTTDTFEITGDRLTIAYNDGSGVLNFVKTSPTPRLLPSPLKARQSVHKRPNHEDAKTQFVSWRFRVKQNSRLTMYQSSPIMRSSYEEARRVNLMYTIYYGIRLRSGDIVFAAVPCRSAPVAR